MTIYLLFLPLISLFKIVAVFFSLFYLYELFFNKIVIDPIEGIIIYNKYPFYLNSVKINAVKFGLLNFIVVRLGYKKRHVLCYFGDVESDCDLIKEYLKIYTPGGVRNW
jgi:hypothetical protein